MEKGYGGRKVKLKAEMQLHTKGNGSARTRLCGKDGCELEDGKDAEDAGEVGSGVDACVYGVWLTLKQIFKLSILTLKLLTQASEMLVSHMQI